MVRQMIKIEEDLCNGCGLCATACHEGAITIVDGKAKIIRDDYCDGLGNCLPVCPTGAISFEEREALDYDEEAVQKHQANLHTEKYHTENHASGSHENGSHGNGSHGNGHGSESHGSGSHGGGCPGSMARAISRESNSIEKVISKQTREIKENSKSELMQWPVQIKLVPVKAPYFDQANLLIAADCTAYAYANFHEEFMKKHVTIIGCPKLDEGDYSEKLTEIIKHNNIKSVKVVRMEVPCCGGIENAVIQALKNSGKMLPWQVITISCDGQILE